MKRLVRMLTASALSFALMLSGCGQPSPESGIGAGNDGEEGILEHAMGRYEEQSLDAENTFTHFFSMSEQKDGSLMAFDYNQGMFVSKDQGMTWETRPMAWYDEIGGKVPISEVKISADGYIGVLYDANYKKESGSKTENEIVSYDFSSRMVCFVVSPQGTKVEVELPGDGWSDESCLCFAENGKLFGAAADGILYEINKDTGTSSRFAELPSCAGEMTAGSEVVVCIYADGIMLFEQNSGEEIKDDILNKFLTSNIGENTEWKEIYDQVFVVPAEEKVLYIFCSQGIYRHAIGGSATEQVVDGAISTLGNPVYRVQEAMVREDNSFFILFSGNKLLNYKYNPDIPSVPSIRLKAYSLTENELLKMAIAQYQETHPDVYVEYETGISGTSSVTRDDVIKKLNTQIMAGTGPDLIVLDDMPMDSYINKGILLDLQPYIEDLLQEDKLLGNMIEAFRTDAEVYAVPLQFSIPLLVGNAEDVEMAGDLSALTSVVESKRNNQADSGILGAMQAEDVLEQLIPVCAPAWKKSSKELDQKALTEFLMYAKRIWEAEQSGITSEMEADYVKKTEEYKAMGMNEEETRKYRLSLEEQTFGFLLGKQKLALGNLADDFQFSTVSSVFQVKGMEDSRFSTYGGQVQNVFIPHTLVGINAGSVNQEQAGDLLKTLLGGQFSSGSYSINRESLAQVFVNHYSDTDELGIMGIESGENGEMLSITVKWPMQEEIDRLMKYIEQANTPYIRDMVLENAVKESGAAVLKGETSVEDAIAQIVNQTAIYLAE